MRAAPVKLTPLTSEEQRFAAENHDVLLWCMQVLHLPKDTYDIAAEGYLQAVKKWHIRPDLHDRSFRTIAKWAVRSRINNARRVEERQIKTVSLDAVIPGTNGLTLASMVTYDNMDYLYKKESRTVEIKYDVKIPETAKMSRLPCVEIEALMEFLSSNHKTMCLSYETPRQAGNKASNLRGWIKKNGKTDVAVYKSGASVYVEKLVNKKGAKQT